MVIRILRIDSTQYGPVSFFSDYYHSFSDTITCYISSERLYLSLSNDKKHIIIIYEEYLSNGYLSNGRWYVLDI